MATNGNGQKTFDEDAFKKSVQVVPPGEGPFSSALGDSFIFLAQTIDEVEPWGRNIKQRDIQLRAFAANEPIFSSALATVCARNAAMPWKIEGPTKVAEDSQRILQTANFGAGWQDFSLKLSRDLYTQDNSAFVEIIRAGKSADAEVIGIANLDSARCYHTGHPDVPVLYLDRNNKYHWLAWYQVVVISEMPATHEGLHGLQYSAVTRLFRSIKTQRDIGIYLSEKIGGRNPRAIHLLRGVAADEVVSAWQKVGFQNDTAGLTRFSNPVMVSSINPDVDVDVKTLEIAAVPDGFDMAEHWKQYIAQIAMAFLSDYQEFAPLPGGNLGTASQSETQHKKSSRTGIAIYRGAVEHFLNWAVFPEEVEMSYEEPDLDAEQAEALARKTRAEERKLRIESQEITAAIARMRALSSDDLTQEEYDEAEKQAEEQAKQEEEAQQAQLEAMQQQQQQPGQNGQKPPNAVDSGGQAASQRRQGATAPVGEEQAGKALDEPEPAPLPTRPRTEVERHVETAIDGAFGDLWSALQERAGIEDLDETVKFTEGDWVRNSGRFAQFVGQGGGSGGSGAAGAGAAIAGGLEARLDPRNVRDFVDLAADSPPANLSLLQITGPGNENLFREHARDLGRHEMPQLPTNSAGRQDFSVYLAMNGLAFRESTVDPRELRATQRELDSRKVSQIAKRATNEGLSDNAIFTSKDGEVLDGHHRWAAVSLNAIINPGTTITQIQVDADIDTLLRVSHEFMRARGLEARSFGTETSGRKAMMTSQRGQFGETPLVPPPDAGKPYMWLNGRWLEVMQDDPEDYLPFEAVVKALEEKSEEDVALWVAEKFNEADWQRNSGRFANYIGQGGPRGGRSGGGGASAGATTAGHQRPGQRPAGSGSVSYTDPKASARRAGTTLSKWRVPPDRDTMSLYKTGPKSGDYVNQRKAIHDQMVADVTNGVPVRPEGERTFFVLGGGGGSGKTYLVKKGKLPVPSEESRLAVNVNADKAKERLPEFDGAKGAGNSEQAARIVHEESSDMTKGQMKAGWANGQDVTLDGVGDGSVGGLRDKANAARAAGYKVKGYYVSTDVDRAVQAAKDRAANPEDESYQRVVPEARLRGDHRSVSKILPAAIDDGVFDEVEIWDNQFDDNPTKVFSAVKNPDGTMTKTIHDEAGYQTFLNKANAPRHPSEDDDGSTGKTSKLAFDLTDLISLGDNNGGGRRSKRMAEKATVEITPELDQKIYMAAFGPEFPESGIPDNPETRKRFAVYQNAIKKTAAEGYVVNTSADFDWD